MLWSPFKDKKCEQLACSNSIKKRLTIRAEVMYAVKFIFIKLTKNSMAFILKGGEQPGMTPAGFEPAKYHTV